MSDPETSIVQSLMDPIDALSDDDAVARLDHGQLVAADILDLSDDEQRLVQPEPTPELPCRSRRRTRKAVSDVDSASQHGSQLTRAVKTNCKCKGASCRSPWRESPEAFDKLLNLRMVIHSLPKLDADEEVPWLNKTSRSNAHN